VGMERRTLVCLAPHLQCRGRDRARKVGREPAPAVDLEAHGHGLEHEKERVLRRREHERPEVADDPGRELRQCRAVQRLREAACAMSRCDIVDKT
jgi:hypothetical protein